MVLILVVACWMFSAGEFRETEDKKVLVAGEELDAGIVERPSSPWVIDLFSIHK